MQTTWTDKNTCRELSKEFNACTQLLLQDRLAVSVCSEQKWTQTYEGSKQQQAKIWYIYWTSGVFIFNDVYFKNKIQCTAGTSAASKNYITVWNKNGHNLMIATMAICWNHFNIIIIHAMQFLLCKLPNMMKCNLKSSLEARSSFFKTNNSVCR